MNIAYELSSSDLESFRPLVQKHGLPLLRRSQLSYCGVLVMVLVMWGLINSWELNQYLNVSGILVALLLCLYLYDRFPRRISRLLGQPGKRVLELKDDQVMRYSHSGKRPYECSQWDIIKVLESGRFFLLLFGESAACGEKIVPVPKQSIEELDDNGQFLSLLKEKLFRYEDNHSLENMLNR